MKVISNGTEKEINPNSEIANQLKKRVKEINEHPDVIGTAYWRITKRSLLGFMRKEKITEISANTLKNIMGFSDISLAHKMLIEINNELFKQIKSC